MTVLQRSSLSNPNARISGLAAIVLLAVLPACSDSNPQAPPESIPESTPDSHASDSPAPTPKRNLILIMIDTLRADHVGAYGSDVPTPNLDSLAAGGVLFEQAYAHIPLTGPSHASLFTSTIPSEHGCTVNSQTFPEENHTLAEILHEHGWGTAGFISLGVLREDFGFAQGFDSFAGLFHHRWWKGAEEVNASLFRWIASGPHEQPQFLFLHYSDPHSPYAPPNLDYPEIEVRLGESTLASIPADSRERQVTVTLDSLREDYQLVPPEGFGRKSLGCWSIRTNDREVMVKFADDGEFQRSFKGVPPFQSLPTAFRLVNISRESKQVELNITFRRRIQPNQLAELYRQEVAYTDSQIGLAIEALKQAGLWENSVVLFSADHGEGLGEHDLVGHVEQLYDSLLRVPMILMAPGLLPDGEVVRTPVAHVDVLPTLLDLLGVSVADRFRGQSMLPLLESASAGERSPILGETHEPEAKINQRSVVHGGYKYILNRANGQEELYELQTDPGELNNLAEQRLEVLAQIRAVMVAEYERTFGPGVGIGDQQELSEEDKLNLKGIGYAR